MLAGPPRLVSALTLALLLAVVIWYFPLVHPANPLRYDHSKPPIPQETTPVSARPQVDPLDFSIPLRFTEGQPKPPGSNYTSVLVIPKTKDEDIGWMQEEIPEIKLVVYEVDNPNARYHPPKNKGREAMVYLTYLIDHYDELPDIILFFHSHRYAWHNNVLLGIDSAQAIRRINPDRVMRMGYMNTRCAHEPGCPDWIHMDRPAADFDFFRKPEEIYYRRHVWEELHPGAPIPPSLSQPCCAQFALSRERVRQVPIERFIHYRNWLLNTKMDDQFSGRVFEYIWQYIFTGNAVYCPAMNTCYCDGYGVCFGGREKFNNWMERLDKRNGFQEEVNKLNKQKEEEGATDEKRLAEFQAKVNELDPDLEKERQEAYKRGEDPAERAKETETYSDEHIWDGRDKPDWV